MITVLLVLLVLELAFILTILVQVFYLSFLEKKRIKDFEAYKKFIEFDNKMNNK